MLVLSNIFFSPSLKISSNAIITKYISIKKIAKPNHSNSPATASSTDKSPLSVLTRYNYSHFGKAAFIVAVPLVTLIVSTLEYSHC